MHGFYFWKLFLWLSMMFGWGTIAGIFLSFTVRVAFYCHHPTAVCVVSECIYCWIYTLSSRRTIDFLQRLFRLLNCLRTEIVSSGPNAIHVFSRCSNSTIVIMVKLSRRKRIICKKSVILKWRIDWDEIVLALRPSASLVKCVVSWYACHLYKEKKL